MASSVLSPVKIDYPSSDGKPVAETDVHINALLYARGGLHHHFRHRPDVYVAGDLLIYYEEGNPKARVAPDIFVVLGVANHVRSSYFLWEERKGPDFVLEITSAGTRREDQGKKRRLYRRLGVREYWQYDPMGEWLQPPLRCLELVAGEYEELPGSDLADEAMTSRVLGLELRVTEDGLRFHDPVTGQNIHTLAETDAAWRREQQARQAAEAGWQASEEARQAAEAGWQASEEARRAAEARVAELEAMLRRERGRDS